jgi:hypothetical protein
MASSKPGDKEQRLEYWNRDRNIGEEIGIRAEIP